LRITEQNTVNTISNSQPAGFYDTPKAGTGGASGSQNVDASGSDRIDLGAQNDLVSQAQTAGTDARAARIEQLRLLVQSGQYQVDPVALSQSIVQSALNGY
jgi:anti-sigma28 factor (negative regulator of flagellin synthesis)